MGGGLEQVVCIVYEIIITDCYSNKNQRIVLGEFRHAIMINVIGHCRPGHYQHDVIRNRHVEVIGAFGGNTLLKEAVVIKCTNGIKDQVSNWLLCNTVKHYPIV